MRQLILENQTVKNGLIILDSKNYRYLKQVLRVKPGDMLNVRLGDGSLVSTTVARIEENSKKITLQICSTLEIDKTITRGVQANEINETSEMPPFWLFQFIPKPQKFEQIVRQATECGACVIVPVIGEYSEKNSVSALSSTKKERMDRIIREARQQSGSPVDTKLLEPLTVEDAVALWEKESSEGNSFGVVLSERNDKCVPLDKIIPPKTSGAKWAVVIGSEGGISPAEIEKLCKNALFQPVHFAVNILRCETAALYGIAAVQTKVIERL